MRKRGVHDVLKRKEKKEGRREGVFFPHFKPRFLLNTP